MPDANEPLSRGRFLKLCAAGAIGLAATACGAGDDDDEEENDDDEENGDDENGGEENGGEGNGGGLY